MLNSESKKNPARQVKPIRKRKSKYINMDSNKRKLDNDGKNAPDAKFRNFLDNLDDVVYESDASGNVTYANKTAEKITGIPLKDIIGKPFLPLFTNESQQVANKVYKRTLNGERTEYELTFTNRRVCHFKNEPLRDENGQVAGVFGIARDITRRKQVEKTLRDSEERYKNLFNNSLMGLYRTTPDGRILMANPALVRMLGYDSFEELARRNLEDEGYHPEYPRSVFKERVGRESKVIGLESAWKRADGTTLYVRESAQAVRDESGNIMYYEGTVEDITEHRQIAMALQSSKEMFEALVANMNEGVDIVDENLCCLFANPAGEEIFGVEAGGLVGRTLYGFISEEGHKRIEEQLSKRRKGVASSYDLEIIRPDGRKRQLIVTGTPRFSEDGKYLGALAIFFDVTKRKQAEEALRNAHNELEVRIQKRTAELQRANEALQAQIAERINAENELKKSKDILQKTFTSLDSAVFILDAKNPPVIIDCNPAATRIFGYENEEMLGKTTEFLHVSRETLQEFQKALNQAIREQGGLSFFEFKMRRKDGRVFPSEHSVRSLKDDKGRTVGWVSVVRDITERKQAEEELRQSEKEKSTILENMSELIAYRNIDMETVWASKSAADWHGLSREEILGRVCYKARYGRKEPCEDCYVIETMKSGKYRELDTQSPDGKYWHVKVNPVFNDSGQVIGTIEVSQDITERMQAEESLLETTNLLETIFAHTHILVAYLDQQFNFVRVNRAYAVADDREPSFFVGKNHFDLYPNEENEKIFHEVVETGNPYFAYAKPFEYAEHPERGISYWDWSLVPIKNQQGIVSGLVFTLTDVTSCKLANNTLKEREEMIRSLVETSRDWIWSIDVNGIHTYCNPAVETILGYSPDDLVGKCSLDLMHDEDRKSIDGKLPYWIETKSGWNNLLIRWRHNDGSYRFLESNAVPILNSEDTLIGFRGVDRDITERKRTEDTLRQYKFMVESAHDAIFFKDRQSKYIIANKKTLESFGLPREKVIGKSDYEIMPKREQANNNIEDDKVVFETGKPKEIIKEMTDSNGRQYWFQAVKVPHFDENGNVIGLIGIARDITERMQAQEELRIREQKLRALLNAPTESAILIDVDGTILDINRIAAQRIGKSVEELIGTRVYGYFPSEIAEFRKARGEDVINSGKSLRFQDEREGHYYDNNLYPVFDDKGKVNAVAVFSQDITERKQADQALRESEEKFRSLAEQSPNMIFINRKGKIVYVNNRCEEVMGYKREELCSEDFDFRNLVAPESIELINDNFARHLRGEDVRPYDYSIIRKDGKRIEAINTSKLIQYEGQSAILGIVTDITERKKSEQALRESEERLKILFESAPDAIYLIDSEGRFVDGNKAAEDLIGFEKTEVIGKSLAELGLLSAGQLSKAQTNLRKVAAGKLSGPNEYTIRRQDGSHVSVEVRTFPVKIGGKLLTLGIARDITEHKRTEKKLLEHQAKLKSLASRLSLAEERERYRLATDLHDQISQSLVISKIKLDQLCKSSGSNEFKESLKDISNCLGQVIDDTRALTFDLSYPILYELGFEAAVAEWLTDQIQVKHGIETEFVDDGHKKPLDDDIRVLLFRNVRELLINVVKHAQPKKVKVSISRIKDNIRIIVEDDGIGFDPVEVMSMSAKRAEFGLFSVRERLEHLGGLIEIDSEVGRGSKITMTAPLKN